MNETACSIPLPDEHAPAIATAVHRAVRDGRGAAAGLAEARLALGSDPAVADILTSALAQDLRAYYAKVFERYALRDKIRLLFETYDVLVSPTLPVSSVDVGRNVPEGYEDRNLLSWVYYTYPFNLTGQPAASTCAGFGTDGMPIGMQIVGRVLGEADVVRTAAALERVEQPWLQRSHEFM